MDVESASGAATMQRSSRADVGSGMLNHDHHHPCKNVEVEDVSTSGRNRSPNSTELGLPRSPNGSRAVKKR